MSFCTAINCMDGRVQLPVIRYLMERFGTDYIDSITEAGPVKILAEQTDRPRLNSIFERVTISIDKHGSKTLAISAHADCAGNPVDDEIQQQQLNAAAELLKKTFPAMTVLTLWVDSTWSVHALP